VTLFDEALRVLAPGGLAIFETPNPENIIVGACNFYIDPTHRNPLPPDPIKFIAEQRGFVRVEILRLHRLKEMQPTGQEILDDVIRRFTMEQDYSIIGYKE
jgi:O-antigen chain-terminating methyltransferase